MLNLVFRYYYLNEYSVYADCMPRVVNTSSFPFRSQRTY